MDVDPASSSPLDLAFHGSRQSRRGGDSVSSILQQGMLPHFRQHGGDWFSRTFSGSLRYAARMDGKMQLIAFLLLVQPPAYSSDSAGVVVMTDSKYELPIAAVTFENGRY